MDGKKVRVGIADDHAIFRDGLQRLLEQEEEFEVVAQASDGAESVTMVLRHQPAILLLDLAMPKLSGVEVLRELAQLRSPTRSIVLTGGISRRQTIEVLQAGAYGLVTKESPTQVLLKAIHTVVRGLHWMDNGPVTDVAAYLRGLMQVRATGSSNSSFGLTRRENEILGTIVGGLSNKEIAQRFSLSEDTVKHHLTNIFDKVGVSSRLELALFAIQHRLVEG